MRIIIIVIKKNMDKFVNGDRVKWLLAAPARLSYWLASLVLVSTHTTNFTRSRTYTLMLHTQHVLYVHT